VTHFRSLPLSLQINATAPPFKQPSFVYTLAEQIEQLRGRELPGFMSSQVSALLCALLCALLYHPRIDVAVDVMKEQTLDLLSTPCSEWLLFRM
jgi:hypothetical protein